MGMYLEVDSKGNSLGHKGKADKLIADGAKELKIAIMYVPYLVCVVDNGMFEAAGFCFNENEFNEFYHGLGGRPARWVSAEAAVKKNFRPQTITEHLLTFGGD